MPILSPISSAHYSAEWSDPLYIACLNHEITTICRAAVYNIQHTDRSIYIFQHTSQEAKCARIATPSLWHRRCHIHISYHYSCDLAQARSRGFVTAHNVAAICLDKCISQQICRMYILMDRSYSIYIPTQKMAIR